MVTIVPRFDFSNVLRMLDDTQARQLPFATAKALTLTAKNVEKSIYDEMRSQFDRPTPMTMRSLRTKPATKRDLTAMVYLKGIELGGKNPYSMAEVIGHQFSGGSRTRKRIEKVFERAGLISGNEYLAPGEAARLDQYGNMSRGQIQQIMSQLKVGTDPYANKSASARSRANVKAAGAMFWSRGGRLPRGVWMRNGISVKPILIVVSRPQYKIRINMQVVADKVIVRDFNRIFSTTMRDALRSAR